MSDASAASSTPGSAERCASIVSCMRRRAATLSYFSPFPSGRLIRAVSRWVAGTKGLMCWATTKLWIITPAPARRTTVRANWNTTRAPGEAAAALGARCRAVLERRVQVHTRGAKRGHQAENDTRQHRNGRKVGEGAPVHGELDPVGLAHVLRCEIEGVHATIARARGRGGRQGRSAARFPRAAA